MLLLSSSKELLGKVGSRTTHYRKERKGIQVTCDAKLDLLNLDLELRLVVRVFANRHEGFVLDRGRHVVAPGVPLIPGHDLLVTRRTVSSNVAQIVVDLVVGMFAVQGQVVSPLTILTSWMFWLVVRAHDHHCSTWDKP